MDGLFSKRWRPRSFSAVQIVFWCGVSKEGGLLALFFQILEGFRSFFYPVGVFILSGKRGFRLEKPRTPWWLWRGKVCPSCSIPIGPMTWPTTSCSTERSRGLRELQ